MSNSQQQDRTRYENDLEREIYEGRPAPEPLVALRCILVGVNGSPESERAARMAARIARAGATKVRLLSVCEPCQPALAHDLRLAAENTLDDLRRALEQNGIHIEGAVEVGDPAEVLSRRANDRDVDLVVVGRKASNRVGRASGVGVNERLAEACQKPLLVVK